MAERSWEDAWLLGSVIIARDSDTPDLAGVIGIADYINRLVVSRNEIVSAVNRLRAGNLVEPSDPLMPQRNRWFSGLRLGPAERSTVSRNFFS